MEITKFRKSKSKIESKYRDLQKSTADMQQQFKVDIDKLNQQLIRYYFYELKKRHNYRNCYFFSDLNRANLEKEQIWNI